jgi:hypothetical protein
VEGQKDPLEQGRWARAQSLPRNHPPDCPLQFLCLLVRISWTAPVQAVAKVAVQQTGATLPRAAVVALI